MQDGFRKWLNGRPGMRIAFETGTHSGWVGEILKTVGHEVLVANTRQVRLIWAGRDKTDRIDARKLTRLARLEPELLAPIEHRSAERQSSLAIVRARDALVGSRSLLINTTRALLRRLDFAPSVGVPKSCQCVSMKGCHQNSGVRWRHCSSKDRWPQGSYPDGVERSHRTSGCGNRQYSKNCPATDRLQYARHEGRRKLARRALQIGRNP